MPTACGYTWSGELDIIIREESAAAFVPLDLAYTFIAAESGFNPNAHALTALEDSVGLLQMNRRGGQGQGYTVAQLRDPRFNLRLGLPFIAAAYAGVWSATIQPYDFLHQLAVRSGHPGAVQPSDPRIVRTFNIWACFNSGVGQAGPGGSPAAAFVPGPGQALTEFAASFTLLFLFPGGLIRRLLSVIDPKAIRGRMVGPFSPGYYRSRFIGALDPRRLDPRKRLLAVFDPRIRRPPGHRPPRGFGPGR